ncbi:hypothetical protein [Arthrobacter sp. fls2-241-R2A-200]|uniref:hypothetical protein n=1 Tax=Arthrobacter sp. fls2-241-R2A-200 TaxID=3040281 RepID=UPI00254F2C1D|nr:hypothetical protein [Arthrobacter sp. fls2-241-R2A-200]
MTPPKFFGQVGTRLRDGSRKKRWLITLFAALMVAAAVGMGPGPVTKTLTGAAKVQDLPRYPISGYFISPPVDSSDGRTKLADIKAAGGDTVITFGTLLTPASANSLPADCSVSGENCSVPATKGIVVNRYFTYLDGDSWGRSALKCPRDQIIFNNGRSFAVFVLPTTGDGCDSSDGRYDVVVAGGGQAPGTDTTGGLAAAATRSGMHYYAGLPAPVKRTDVDYLPDLSYMGTLSLFTERFLQYQAAVNNVAGLAGFYHHIEMPLSDSPVFDPILELYKSQNQLVHKYLPTRSAVISPYLDTRVGAADISPDTARRGIEKIAGTSSGVVVNIAIQDGMGTGKGGAYLPSEASAPVDSYAAAVVGDGSWKSKYVAPTGDYFRAAASGIEGTGAVLWANLEGMTPTATGNTCGAGPRGQTTLPRMDMQLQQMGAAKKVISFMWDPYFTCKGTGTPLKNQLISGYAKPVITGSTFSGATGQIHVTGFNLEGGLAQVTWADANGSTHTKVSEFTDANTAYGQKQGLNPKLEALTLSVGTAAIPSGTRYSISLTNRWGAAQEIPYAGIS